MLEVYYFRLCYHAISMVSCHYPDTAPCSTLHPILSKFLNDLLFCLEFWRNFTINLSFLSAQNISLGLWSCWVLKSITKFSSGHSVGVGGCLQYCGFGHYVSCIMALSDLVFSSLNSSGPCLTKEDARCSPCIDSIPSAATTDKENFASFPTF